MSRLLSPLLYISRNRAKSAPIAFVIALSVALVASVVSIVHSIDLTIYTLYGYNRYLTGVTPRNDLNVSSEQVQRIRKLPELGTLFLAHSYQTRVKTIFGKMSLPIFGLDPAGRDMIMARCQEAVIAGRMPAEGAAEAVISDSVATNMGLKLGDVMLRPDSEDNYAPVPVRLVGLLHGPVWLGVTSRRLVEMNSPFTGTGYLAFAPTARLVEQRRLDAAMDRAVDKSQTRVWQYSGLVRETQSSLSNLYLILDIVVAIIVFAISFVCGLLSNIYFMQRLPEVAMLSAIGYSRRFLLKRALGETALLGVVGWIAGSLLTFALLFAVRALLLAPKGLLLDPLDLRSFEFTFPLPVAITLIALITIAHRLSRLDPVSIIERRG